MNDIKKEFDKVHTPVELLKFMSKYINYGYLGKSGRVYRYDDSDFNDKWFNEYILESEDDILQTGFGNCWDQVELERYWFLRNGYQIKTIYEMVKLDYDNLYPTHAFLVFKDHDGNWNWFENSDFNNRGIHEFSSVDELLNYQYKKYVEFLKTFNIRDEEIENIILTEFDKPLSHISALEYLDFVTDAKKILVSSK